MIPLIKYSNLTGYCILVTGQMITSTIRNVCLNEDNRIIPSSALLEHHSLVPAKIDRRYSGANIMKKKKRGK